MIISHQRLNTREISWKMLPQSQTTESFFKWWCWWCSYWYFEWKYRPEFYSLRTLDKYEVDRSKIIKSENKPKTHQFLEETDVWASFRPLQYTAHSTEPLTWHFKHSSHLCVHSTKLTRAKKANFAIYNMLIGSSLCKRELKTTNRVGRNNSEASSYCSLLLCLKKPEARLLRQCCSLTRSYSKLYVSCYWSQGKDESKGLKFLFSLH